MISQHRNLIVLSLSERQTVSSLFCWGFKWYVDAFISYHTYEAGRTSD